LYSQQLLSVSTEKKKSPLPDLSVVGPWSGRLPHPALSPLITKYYSLRDPTLLQKGRTFTGLCSGPLYIHIFDNDAAIEFKHGSRVTKSVFPGVVSGQVSAPTIVTFNRPVRTTSIEYFPVASPLLFGFRAPEIENSFLPLTDVTQRGFDTLIDQIRHQGNMDAKKRILDAFFLRRIAESEKDTFFHRCMGPLYRFSGRVSVGEIQRQSGYSSRQFERKFKEHAGISASVMRRFIRSNCALTRILKNETVNDIVYDLDYVDQSHLIKDIKWYTGKTPKILQDCYRNSYFRLGPTNYILG
jgi:AraC-like DNA-binding protein